MDIRDSEFLDDLVEKVLEQLSYLKSRSRGCEKLKKTDTKKLSSSQKHVVPKTTKVTSMKHLDGGIYVDGQVNGETHVFLLDTSTSKTIVKASVVKKC